MWNSRFNIFFLSIVAVMHKTSRGTESVFACDSNIYCQGPILDTVQRARLFHDSKTFVDMSLKKSPEKTLQAFKDLSSLFNTLPRSQLKDFVQEYFSGPGEEFEPWTPPDYTNLPRFLGKLSDPLLRDFGWNLCRIWRDLGRKIRIDVKEHQERYSLMYLPYPFIIPGGRFRETYYWDSYWVMKGLLTCQMTETAKGMLLNFVHYIKRFAFIPNGGRIYQSKRSQPPFFIPMVYDYYTYTNDTEFLRQVLPYMEQEYMFWMDNRSVEVWKNAKRFMAQRYATILNNPRPESYIEDTETAKFTDEILEKNQRSELYSSIASATETGMGFSSRWFSREDGSNNLNTTITKQIIPVDLNSILCMNERLLADICSILGEQQKYVVYSDKFRRRKILMEDLFWNSEQGIWQDFSLATNTSRDYFFPSNIFPLFAACVEDEENKMTAVLKNLKTKGILDFKGGIPASLITTGEQWDFPNGWPPIQHVFIRTLTRSSNPKAKVTGLQLAKMWLRSNYQSWNRSRVIFEKYSVVDPGTRGGGGEYNVQEGFGWTNGVLLDLMEQFGDQLNINDFKSERSNPTCVSSASLYVCEHASTLLIFLCTCMIKLFSCNSEILN